MKCKACGKVEFRLAHRTPLERCLSQVIPVRPYRCTACAHRQMRRIKPFFNASRLVSAFVFGFLFTFLSTTLIGSWNDREPNVTADDRPAWAKQSGRAVSVEPTSSEPLPKQTWKSAFGPQNPSPSPVPVGHVSSTRMLTEFEDAAERDIRPDRHSAATAELERTPASVLPEAGRNRMAQAPVKPRSVSVTRAAPPREERLIPDRLDTVEIDSSRQIVRVYLQGRGPFDQFKMFELDQGERLVVDVPGNWTLASGMGTAFFVNADWLYRIRLGEHAAFFRLVFDVKANRSARPQIETSSGAMTITLIPG